MEKTKKIEFESRLYSIEAIKTALKAFDDVCKAKIEKSKDSNIVSISAQEEDIEEIIKEFSNYVLGCMKEINS